MDPLGADIACKSAPFWAEPVRSKPVRPNFDHFCHRLAPFPACFDRKCIWNVDSNAISNGNQNANEHVNAHAAGHENENAHANSNAATATNLKTKHQKATPPTCQTWDDRFGVNMGLPPHRPDPLHNCPLKGIGVRDYYAFQFFFCLSGGFPLDADRNFERKLRI